MKRGKIKGHYVKGGVNVPRHIPVIKVNLLLFIILFKTKKIQACRQMQLGLGTMATPFNNVQLAKLKLFFSLWKSMIYTGKSQID